jgi:hypothetical protein
MHLIEQFRILASEVQARSGVWGDLRFGLRIFITLPILLVAAFIGFLSMSSAEIRHASRSRDGHGDARGR